MSPTALPVPLAGRQPVWRCGAVASSAGGGMAGAAPFAAGLFTVIARGQPRPSVGAGRFFHSQEIFR